MLTILYVIVGLSLLILVHEFGHFAAAKYFKLRVEEFGIGFPPRLFSFKRGETEYSVNALPLGGFVKITGEHDERSGEEKTLSEAERKRSFAFQLPWRRSVVTGSGVGMNFLLGWFFLSIVFMVGTPRVLLVESVAPGSPAEAAGIRSGDIIRSHETADEFISFIDAHRGASLAIPIVRNNEEMIVTATPRIATEEGEGALGVFLVEGGVFQTRNPFLALGRGFLASVSVVKESILAFYMLLKTLFFEGSLLQGVVGPIGIFGIAAGAGKLGAMYLIQLLAIISLNLAVLNLIPFPALDGGRLAMIAFEKAKGKPISKKTETIINSIGFIALLALMAAITVRDIARLW